ncbi:MAG: ATP-dependent helicase [Vicinamibacteria bacterium]
MNRPTGASPEDFAQDILSDLNSGQRAAVTAPDGPVLVLAGAGSGKTRAIAHRIAFLVRERNAPPWTILAVTFTNKAAGEMRARVDALAGPSANEIWVSTFHSLGMRLLRQFGADIGLSTRFRIYDEQDRRSVLRRVLQEIGATEREYPLPRLAAAVSARKNAALGGEDSPRWWRSRDRDVLDRVFARYQTTLQSNEGVDFDDLLVRTVELLECSEKTRAFAERRFRHLLIDEYQDTNRVQYRMMRLLAPHQNLFVVGDEDQSIYNFRGADLRNILEFEKDFPSARVVKLEDNYRSTSAILDAATTLISHNEERKGKKLVARTGAGEKPRAFALETDWDECFLVADQIDELREESPSIRIAVLVRTHAQTRLFEEEFVRRGIPHLLVGGQRFYDRREVKDALSYLRLILNPEDNAAFLRAINTPPRGFGAATLALTEQRAAERGLSLWQAATQIAEENEMPARASQGLTALREIRETLTALAGKTTLGMLVKETLRQSGLATALERESSVEAEARLENLDELVTAAIDYQERETEPSLAGFLDSVSLLTDLDTVREESPCLLMTLHSAKGLEFDAVFLTGLEEGLFPHFRSAGDRKAIEEERRLCYVGMTRARTQLVLTYALSRRTALEKEGRTPSRFLDEVSPALSWSDPPVRSTASPPSGPPAPVHRASAGSRFSVGAVVRHPRFGEGKIISAEPPGGDQKITVDFDRVGRKKLVARFANLELLKAGGARPRSRLDRPTEAPRD